MVHIGDRYGQLVQMSYITRDMDAAVAHAEAELGITGLTRGEAEIEVLSYGEKRPLAVKSAIANAGSRQFEIIQPVSGAIGIYTDAVDLSGHILNFHHIGIAVPGPRAEWLRLLEDVKASEDAFAYLFPAVPSAEDKLCFCYVDTRRRLGHYTEYLWADPSLTGIPAAPWLTA
ncbi:VOC family protein [Novosphingobium mangrovi (ex Huang et al. 2023)]|uniref:VOC family protein n=1 Tax=Novosphingobium mangrovi (ex Huang et al. 2023) TaxID=2976432 RepID=A0ABT2I070_9SPHN|nr:VOC family protein [Novosphingobium mangrovi (ex Huang et al. 2023)]MCT2398192.1 VOC family protein [Novosphingobium mangrovi (ex Huang et al. 2023)]